MPTYSSQQCKIQTCSQKCCNYQGTCIDTTSSSSYENTCWYYYTSYADACGNGSSACATGNNVSVLIGGIAGGIFGLILLVIFVVIACRKCRENRVPDQVVMAKTTGQVIITPAPPLDYSNSFPTTTYQTYPPPFTPTYQPQPQPYIQQTYPPAYQYPPQYQPQYQSQMVQNMNNDPQYNSPTYLVYGNN